MSFEYTAKADKILPDHVMAAIDHSRSAPYDAHVSKVSVDESTGDASYTIDHKSGVTSKHTFSAASGAGK